MYIAYVVVAVLFALMLVGSGRGKLVREKRVTETITGLGVPLSWFLPLALLEIAAAVGLLIGIAYRPLGIAAGIGAFLYFVGAVITHLRAKDTKGSVAPGVLVLVSVAPVVLGFLSL
ncbi:DoxX family protein [Streptomyces sp. NPDC005953]|uniref:DoxX family protein n=1 Tax=unclassified Streptomyces TaxID=2593676 RepID=UPI0033CCC163